MGRIVEHTEARFLLLGVTPAGRRAAGIFTPRGERFRLVTCRAMRPSEREVYGAS